LGEGDESLGSIAESRALDVNTARILLGKVAVEAKGFVVLATVGRITVAITPAVLAIKAALTSISTTSAAMALLDSEVDMVLFSPSLSTVVTSTSIRLRVRDPRAVEAINEDFRRRSVQGSRSLPKSTRGSRVAHWVLATVLPVTVVVTAKSIVASISTTSSTTSIALRELSGNRRKTSASNVTVVNKVTVNACHLNTLCGTEVQRELEWSFNAIRETRINTREIAAAETSTR